MSRVGLEPTVPIFELPKTVCALDCAVTVNGAVLHVAIKYSVDH
jgi:hypothetical protein